MFETLDLCVSLQGTEARMPHRRDMAKMKIESLHHYHAPPRLFAEGQADRLPSALRSSGFALPADGERGPEDGPSALIGFSARRSLPKWRRSFRRSLRRSSRDGKAGEFVLFVDTFNNYFEPENATRRSRRCSPGRLRVHIAAQATPAMRGRCAAAALSSSGNGGRRRPRRNGCWPRSSPTWTRRQCRRPSSLLPSDLRDDSKAMLPGRRDDALAAQALLFEEFSRSSTKRPPRLELKPARESRRAPHGHCIQKAFDVMPAVRQTLALVPGLAIETIESSCCGMAGNFGYEAGTTIFHEDGRAALLPKVRSAGADTIVVADAPVAAIRSPMRCARVRSRRASAGARPCVETLAG